MRHRPFWLFVGLRCAFWLAAALALLWAPLRGARVIPPFDAYGPVSDLLFGTFAQWDAVWFIHIAEFGYDSEQATAFFPLYPLLVDGLAVVLRSTIVAGVLISLVAGGVAAAVLARIARPLLGEDGARTTTLFLALYPIAYVFTSLYSDGLFLALATGSFLAAQRQRGLLAGVLGGLAVATRLVGLALVPALLVLLWPRRRELRQVLRLLPVLLLPAAALGAYCWYLESRFGDAFLFSRVQEVFWNRYTPNLGPLGGLWEATAAGWRGTIELLRHLPESQGYPSGIPLRDQWATWNAVQLGLLVAAFWLTWVAWRRLGPAFGLYSLAMLGVILASPAELVPLVGLPRYLLADFPLFLALAQVTQHRPRLRQVLLFSFAAVGLVAAVAFSRKVWVA